MNSPEKLIQQAGKFIQVGKLKHALDEYVKAYKLAPGNTTIASNIGDLYVRLGNEADALLWYQTLADEFTFQQALPNAIVAYKKILKLSAKNRRAMTALAQLFEKQGSVHKANEQYRSIAADMENEQQHDRAIAIYQKICALDPSSHRDQLELARLLQHVGQSDAASAGYLKAAEELLLKGQASEAAAACDALLNLRPRDRNLAKAVFGLLRRMDRMDRAIEYLQSISLAHDSEFQVLVCETYLQRGELDTALLTLHGREKDPKLYPVFVKVIQGLVERRDLDKALEVVNAVFEISTQLHDEVTLKVVLASLLSLDKFNIPALRVLTTLLSRMNDQRDLEGYLKSLVIAELRSGQFAQGRDNLNKLVIHGKNAAYVDMLQLLDRSAAETNCQTIIKFLETGIREDAGGRTGGGWALGVSEEDLGLAKNIPEQELVLEELD